MKKEKEVYILLTNTRTVLSRAIKFYTKINHNHVSVSLDSSLSEVYSFGRKQVHNPFIGGLVQENMRHPFYSKADCAIYKCKISESQHQHLHLLLRDMYSNRDQYKYHFLGLIGILLNKKFDRQNAYFCSHFIATLFEKIGHPLVYKPACWVTPGDIAVSPKLQLIYEGRLCEYDVNPNFQSLVQPLAYHP